MSILFARVRKKKITKKDFVSWQHAFNQYTIWLKLFFLTLYRPIVSKFGERSLSANNIKHCELLKSKFLGP